ncbi:MAG: hypothetical protein V4525_06980 [Pseudomonadota bacterium]
MLEIIKEIQIMISFFNVDTFGILAISTLVVGGFQTALTHALKEEKTLSGDDRSLIFPEGFVTKPLPEVVSESTSPVSFWQRMTLGLKSRNTSVNEKNTSKNSAF